MATEKMRTAASPAFACYNLRKSVISREILYSYFFNLTAKKAVKIPVSKNWNDFNKNVET